MIRGLEIKIDLNEFWPLIEATYLGSDDHPEKHTIQVTEILVNLPLEAIFDYQRIHDELEDRAYRHELWNAAYIIGEGCGDDSFMDCRAVKRTAPDDRRRGSVATALSEALGKV